MQALDAIDVAAEALQADLLEVEECVFLPAADLVLPVRKPVAS